VTKVGDFQVVGLMMTVLSHLGNTEAWPVRMPYIGRVSLDTAH
jgi:hypothetical protein